MSPVDPSSYSLNPWPFSDSHSTPRLFIDPLDGPIDPWVSIWTTFRTTGLRDRDLLQLAADADASIHDSRKHAMYQHNAGPGSFPNFF